MAYTSIRLENPNTGAVKMAPVGFSWTTLLFSFFPALFRCDWKWATIMFILALLTSGLSALIFMFIYNRLYIKDLIGAGFKAHSTVSSEPLSNIEDRIGIKIPRLADSA